MTFISLKRPNPPKQPDFWQAQIQDGMYQTRLSKNGRPSDSEGFRNAGLQPAAGEEEPSLVARAYGHCRQGSVFEDCRGSTLLPNVQPGACADHFDLKIATGADMSYFTTTLQSLAEDVVTLKLATVWAGPLSLLSITLRDKPLLCVSNDDRDAYGLSGPDNPTLEALLGYLAGLPGVDVATWSDLDEDMHLIVPTIRRLDTESSREWRRRVIEVLNRSPAPTPRPIAPNPTRPYPSYQPFLGSDGARVTPVVF